MEPDTPSTPDTHRILSNSWRTARSFNAQIGNLLMVPCAWLIATIPSLLLIAITFDADKPLDNWMRQNLECNTTPVSSSAALTAFSAAFCYYALAVALITLLIANFRRNGIPRALIFKSGADTQPLLESHASPSQTWPKLHDADIRSSHIIRNGLIIPLMVIFPLVLLLKMFIPASLNSAWFAMAEQPILGNITSQVGKTFCSSFLWTGISSIIGSVIGCCGSDGAARALFCEPEEPVARTSSPTLSHVPSA